MNHIFPLIFFMLLPLHAMAQDSAQQPVQTDSGKAAATDDGPNGIVEYKEYVKTAEYSWCSDLPYNCKRVNIKYEFKKRCLNDSDTCEYFKKGDYSIWKETERIVSGSTEYAVGRTQEGVDEFKKVEEAFLDKGVKVKKRKYSVETKTMEIKVDLDDKTTEVNATVRKMCPFKKDNKLSSACECYLIQDNCGNYVDKNGKVVYNKKYIGSDNKPLREELEKDGCYIANHITERIKCKKPEFD